MQLRHLRGWDDGRRQIAGVQAWTAPFFGTSNTGPVSVEATGMPHHDGMYDSPQEMTVTYEFKDPDWTLVWSQPGQRIPYPYKKPFQVRDGYGAVYHGDKDTLIVWAGDGQTFTSPLPGSSRP